MAVAIALTTMETSRHFSIEFNPPSSVQSILVFDFQAVVAIRYFDCACHCVKYDWA